MVSDKRIFESDVLVIGSGVSGLTFALTHTYSGYPAVKPQSNSRMLKLPL